MCRPAYRPKNTEDKYFVIVRLAVAGTQKVHCLEITSVIAHQNDLLFSKMHYCKKAKVHVNMSICLLYVNHAKVPFYIYSHT